MTQAFSESFLAEMKDNLLQRKKQLEDQLLTFATPDPKQSSNYNAEFPRFGEEEDENASEVSAFENNLTLEGTMEQSLEMINRALQKVEAGEFGLCEKCNQPISQERLRVFPTATKCAANQGCQKVAN
ncbi:MAG: TraR/DksA C4-type zinc finger protein [Candidatus Komeilibacteria bacterium]|nr:TraR/DksA C4-type zinc finger protein [Candidatus Komeilibacteria bacterium]